MDYNKLIEETTNKINNYTFDDEMYKGIYNAAKEKLDAAYNESIRVLNVEHKAARRQAVGDNALATKSLQQELATRGLARSGESAMLSINQSLALRNTVAELARAALQSKATLTGDYNKELSGLEKEQADKTIAAMEKDKEALAGRLEHLETLKADRDKWQADYSLELLKENNRVKELKEQIAREEAEKAAEAEKEKEELPKSGYPERTPDQSPETTANIIMNTCGIYEGNIIASSRLVQNRIRRELARIVCTSGLSEDYTKDVVYELVKHGFDGDFDVAFARSKTLKWINASYQNAYDQKYTELRENRASYTDAENNATLFAQKTMKEFVESLHLTESEKIWLEKLYWN